MLRKIYIITEGDSNLLPGSEVSIHTFNDEVIRLMKEGKQLPTGRMVLLGITRAALRSDSFLSAASFQETTRILTDAAIKGKTDELLGLKENVIIGGLIPAGTGLLKHKFYDYEKPVVEEENNLEDVLDLEETEEEFEDSFDEEDEDVFEEDLDEEFDEEDFDEEFDDEE
jgi:DNA-directed RNA polymerase subunit beta'